MYRLTYLKVRHFRGASSVDVNAEDAAVVLLTGRIGAGKTSVLQGLTFLLEGSVPGMTQADYRPDDGSEVYVEGVFTNKSHDCIVERCLGSGHQLRIDGVECKVQEGQEAIRDALGIPGTDIGPLLNAERFMSQNPGDQAEYLLGVVGSEAVADTALDLADLVADEPDCALLAREIADAIGDARVENVEAAIANAKGRRLIAKREIDRLSAGRHEAANRLTELFLELGVGDAAELSGLAEANEVAVSQLVQQRKVAERDAGQKAAAEGRLEAKRGEVERLQAESVELAADAEKALADTVELGARRSDLKQRVVSAKRIHASYQEKHDQAVAGAESVVDGARKKLQWTESKLREVRNKLAVADERRNELEVLSGKQTCPTCGQELDRDRIERILAASAEVQPTLQQAVDSLMEAVSDRQAVVGGTEQLLASAKTPLTVDTTLSELRAAEQALEDLPAAPDPEALRGQSDRLAATLASREEEIAGLEEALTGWPEDSGMEDIGNKLVALREEAEKITSAQEFTLALGTLDADLADAKTLRERCDTLVNLWPTVVGEKVETGLGPLLDDVAEILTPVCGWKPVWTPDGIFIQGVGFQRPLAHLSDGERLTVGAAWQIALARRIGLGLALVDNAPLIDEKTFDDFIRQIADMAETHGVTFLMAAAPVPAGRPLPDNVAVTWLQEGRVMV